MTLSRRVLDFASVSIYASSVRLFFVHVGARSRIISHLGTWDYFGRSRSHRRHRGASAGELDRGAAGLSGAAREERKPFPVMLQPQRFNSLMSLTFFVGSPTDHFSNTVQTPVHTREDPSRTNPKGRQTKKNDRAAITPRIERMHLTPPPPGTPPRTAPRWSAHPPKTAPSGRSP